MTPAHRPRRPHTVSAPLIRGLLLAGLLGAVAGSTASAAVRLPGTDCLKSSGPRCQAGAIGKTGSGLPFALGGTVTLGSGYVDAASNALYLPVEFGAQQDTQGVVMRVDLATGNRTVLSGDDGEQMHGRGVAYVSDAGDRKEAYDLGRVLVVRPGPAGSLIALVDKGLQQRTELIRVDLKTGDRTLVWASKVFNDAARSSQTAIRDIEQSRFNMGSASLCRGGDRVGLKPTPTFETDTQNAYLFLNNNPSGTGTGLVKVPLTGGACTWVSQYFPDGSSPVGSGPVINTLSPLVFASTTSGPFFIAATGPNPSGNTLFAVHTRTGVRQTISANNVQVPARSVGTGAPLGYLGGMATGPAGVVTARPASGSEDFAPVVVDPGTGDRTLTDAAAGPLKNGRDGSWNVVAAVPGSTLVIVAFGQALSVWEPVSGNSYLLSR